MNSKLESPTLDIDPRILLKGVKQFDPLKDLLRFEAEFPQAMLLMRIGRIHPFDTSPGVNYYTGGADSEVYGNIGEHSLAVARVCEVLAEPLVRVGVITPDQYRTTIERGLTHDANKGVEIMRRKANGDNTAAAYTESAYHTIRPILLAQGVPADLVEYMADAGSETGHGSKKDYIYQDGNGIVRVKPGLWVRKIVHLSDDMTSSSIPSEGKLAETHFVTPLIKMQEARFRERYPWMWTEGLGFDPSGRVTEVKDINSPPEGFTNVGSYAAYQTLVSHGIARQLMRYIDPEVLIAYYVNNAIS